MMNAYGKRRVKGSYLFGKTQYCSLLQSASGFSFNCHLLEQALGFLLWSRRIHPFNGRSMGSTMLPLNWT